MALLAFVVGAGVAVGARQRHLFAITPSTVDHGERVVVVVERGDDVAAIAAALEGGGVVDDAVAFAAWLRKRPDDVAALKAGRYALRRGMSPDELVQTFRRGEQDEIRLTIVEGLRTEEIAARIADAGFGSIDEVLAVMNDDDFIAECGVPDDVPGGVEGYLFPDTYQFSPATPPITILRRMRRRLDEVITPAHLDKMGKQGRTVHDTLTLASLIESEAARQSERAKIAGVFVRRLKRGIKLQTDPTVTYGVDEFIADEDRRIRRSDLRREHPYNTYIIDGLPPGPICSPGLAASEAALNPAPGDDLFFVARGDGTHEFCPTNACHEEAVDRLIRRPAAP